MAEPTAGGVTDPQWAMHPAYVGHGWDTPVIGWRDYPGAPGYDPFGPEGANFNLLIGSAALDPVSGTASHRSYLCEIRPV